MQSLSLILLDVLLKSAVVLSIATGAVVCLRRSSAASRHLVWTAAVVGVLALPVLSFLLPGWSVVPARTATAVPLSVEPAPAAESVVDAEPASAGYRPDESEENETPVGIGNLATLSESLHSSRQGVPTVPPESREGFEENALSGGVEDARNNEISILAVLARWAPWIWLGGGAVVLTPLILGWIGLFRLKRSARQLDDPAWRTLLAELQSALKVRRKVELLQSPSCGMPMTWGATPFFPAKIVVPDVALTDWSDERRRAVLLHELAHVKRRDCLTQTLTRFACALYWCNPFIWLAAHRLLVERERACDDLALLNEIKPSSYAKHLLEIATVPQTDTLAANAGVAMARRSQLGDRLVAILDERRNRKALSWLAVALVVTLIGAIVVPVAMLKAEHTTPEPSDAVEALADVADETEPATEGEIRMVRGRVMDSEGNPIPGAFGEVSAAYEYIPEDGDFERVDRSVVADDAGEFVIRGRAPFASANVRFEGDGFARKVFDRLRTDGEFYELELERGSSVVGRVFRDGVPLSGVEVGMSHQDRGSHVNVGAYTVRTDERGYFRFEHLPSQTRFFLYGTLESFQGYGGIPTRQFVTGREGATADAGVLDVLPALRLEGQVRLAEDTDSGVTLGPGKIVLQRYSQDVRQTEDFFEIVPDADGRFVADVPPGVLAVIPRYDGFRATLGNASLAPFYSERLIGRIQEDKTDLILELEAGEARPRLSGNHQIAGREPLRGAERLSPDNGIFVSGTVLDAETGEPLPVFTVTEGRHSRLDRGLYEWFPARSTRFTEGSFSVSFTEGEEPPAVKVESEGYRPFASGSLLETENHLVIELERGGGPAGVLLRPDGEPAIGVTVFLIGHHNGVRLELDRNRVEVRGISSQQPTPTTTTDASGRFSFAPGVDDYCIIAADDSGFAMVRIDALSRDPDVRLQPWARVEGRLVIGAEPGAEERVGLSRVLNLRDYYPRGSSPLMFYLNATTDEQGSFEFEQVPPVPVRLYHRPDILSENVSLAPEARVRMFVPEAGETHRFTLGGEGRPVVGRLVLRDYDLPIDWQSDLQMLKLIVPEPEGVVDHDALFREHMEALDDAATPEEREAVNTEHRRRRDEGLFQSYLFDSSEEGRAHYFAQRQYPLAFSEDGSFLIEDVPGGDYVLEIELREAGHETTFRHSVPVISSHVQTGTIPESPGGRTDEPFDLGVIELERDRRSLQLRRMQGDL